MRRSFLLAGLVTTAAAVVGSAGTHAQSESPLGGIWTLNRSLSEFKSDIGFNVDWMPPTSGDGQTTGASTAGRGRRGSTGGGGSRGPAAPFSGRRESSE